ncbi:MAG: phasin family protein [Rhodospirillales bacterium]
MTTKNSTTGNPFFDFDVSKFMAGFDPAKVAAEFTKATAEFTPPGLNQGVNTDAFVDAQRRNVEAITAANQTAMEGAKAIAQFQVKFMEQSLATAKKAMNKVSKATSPQDAAAIQAEAAKESFKKAVSGSQELTALAAKSNTEAGEFIAKRVSEGLDEMQELAKSFKN